MKDSKFFVSLQILSWSLGLPMFSYPTAFMVGRSARAGCRPGQLPTAHIPLSLLDRGFADSSAAVVSAVCRASSYLLGGSVAHWLVPLGLPLRWSVLW